MSVKADPFKLFPKQVEQVNIIKYRAAGLQPVDIATKVHAIIKRATSSDQTSAEYGSRTATRHFHLQPIDLPTEYVEDPEALIGFIIKTREGRTYQINDASRGDDMIEGELRFISVYAQPYGRTSL